jgi:hypothetical protein
MVLNLLLAVLATVMIWLFGLLPTFTAPEWLTYDSGGWAFSVGALFHKLGYWFPVDIVGTVFGFIGTILPIAVTVVVLTWLWAMIPVFGKKSG